MKFLNKGMWEKKVDLRLRVVIFNVWSPDQYHLGTYRNMVIRPTPDLLNQKLWDWDPAICVFMSLPEYLGAQCLSQSRVHLLEAGQVAMSKEGSRKIG